MIELRRRCSGLGGGSDAPSFSRLPAGYQEVEYLENAGTSYIITNIKPQVGDKFVVKFIDSLFETNTSVSGIISDNGRFGVGIDTKYKMQINTSSFFTSTIYNSKINTVSFEWGEDEYSLSVLDEDGTLLGDIKQSRTSDFSSIDINIPIFASYLNGQYLLIMRGKVYNYKYLRNGILFAHLIPCYRKSDRVAGMYDIVNDVFYTNAGTGEFLCGADVGVNTILPTEYQQADYLESVMYEQGYPHIDLNISLPNGYAIKTKFNISTYVGETQCLMGATDNLHPYNRNALIIRSTREFGVSAGYAVFASSGLPIELDTEYEIEASTIKDSIYLRINGIEYANTQENNPRSSKSIYLFKNNMLGGNQVFVGILYPTEIYDDSFVLVRHLYPCYRKADNVAGMYDLVSGEFYTNAGMGEFIVGPDVI